MLEPHLKSTVGRRLFVRFLLAALLPIAGLSAYAYYNVGKSLVDAAHHRLMLDGKAYGMSLVESLNRHAAAFVQAVEKAGDDSGAVAPGLVYIQRFPASLPLDSGGARVRLELSADQGPEFRALVGAGPDEWRARLDPEQFWYTEAAPEHFCVFTASGLRVYCTPGLGEVAQSLVPDESIDQNAAVGETEFNEERFLLGFWRARYLPTLDSPGFVVMVATPEALELKALNSYQMVFSAVVLLAIALAAGFSSSQIRRQLAPLLKLHESTQRLSAGELAARSGVSGSDEFGALGRAFDGMAERVELKFKVLGLLSELDRAVLDSSSREAVVMTLLSGLPAVLPCSGAGVVLLHSDGKAELVCRPENGLSDAGMLRIALTAEHLAQLPNGVVWSQLGPTALPVEGLKALSEGAIQCVLAFPANRPRGIDSVLLMAFESHPKDLDEIVQTGRSLADRLSLSAASLERERQLYQQAHYDALTGLPNRLLLRDRLQQAIVHADRNQTSVALLFIDLDGFKQVNDTLGHGEGDALLAEYALRLSDTMRSQDTVARLGGDEFVVLVQDLAPTTAFATVDRIARDLRAALETPFQLQSQAVVAPASVGIALYPDNASSHEDLLKMADQAMYDSKRRIAGGYQFYTSNISAATRDRFELTQDLRDAIHRNEFLLYYQPKVDAQTGSLLGAEALLRWQSPSRGMVLPGRFVHLLDEMGLDAWLGEWVLEQACAQMHAWDVQGFERFPVSINFSPLQFERTPVVDRVRSALASHGLESNRLELEVLESMAANQSPEIRRSLADLRAMGVRIALDDFGTGFSSLVNLTEVPADVLKLDRVFTLGLCSDPRQRQIVELIIAIAKVMRLEVVAEGVETEAQRALLPSLGCDLLQGFLIGRPVAADVFAQQWLRRRPEQVAH